jgi:hypothetical protein
MEEVERQTFVLLHKDVKRLNMTKLMRHFYLHRMFLSLEHSGERFASQVIVVDVTFEQFVNQNFESLTFLENKNTLMKKRKNKVSKINLLNPEPTA